ncbi:MAG: hypothetical protein C5B58_11680, partial [Acidobacteria bacterium]
KEGQLGDEKADKPTADEVRRFARMVRGQEAANAQLLDKMSRWLLYRLTWVGVQEGREYGGIPAALEDLFGDMTKGTTGAFPRFGNTGGDPDEEAKLKLRREYAGELRKAMTPHVRKMLQHKDLVARVNAARVLHRFAELGDEEVSDDMIRILDNPNEHDGVRHWAIKGLREVFNHQIADPAFNQPQVPPARVQRMENGLLALTRWLKSRMELPAELVNNMTDTDKNAIRYVRREAMRTLAATRRPWAVEKATGNQVRREGPIADLLLQIMVADEGKVSPEPSWEERVEAAHDLCLIDIRPGTNYQPDFAVQSMARFVAALGSAANDDKSRSQERWKYFASRLRAGSDILKANIDKLQPNVLPKPVTDYVKKALPQIESVSNNLYDAEKEPQAPQNLNNWLNDNRAPTQELYRNAPPASGG